MIEYKNISRKELAAMAGFSYSSFTNGIKRQSVPAADVALRIAKVLGTSVEELFDEKMDMPVSDKTTMDFVKKYSNLSDRDKKLLENMVVFMSKS